MEGLWKADGRVKEGPGRGHQGPNPARTSSNIALVERERLHYPAVGDERPSAEHFHRVEQRPSIEAISSRRAFGW